MALAPDLQTIVESYELSNAERQDFIKYLTEEIKQLKLLSEDKNFDYTYTAELYKALSDKTKDLANETSEYMIAWHYSELDILEALSDIKDKLERS